MDGGGAISLVVPVQEEKREGEHQEDEEDHHPKSIVPTSSMPQKFSIDTIQSFIVF